MPSLPDVPDPVTDETLTDGAPPWLFGWLGSWLILSGLATFPQTKNLAGAIALAVALSVSYVMIPRIVR